MAFDHDETYHRDGRVHVKKILSSDDWFPRVVRENCASAAVLELSLWAKDKQSGSGSPGARHRYGDDLVVASRPKKLGTCTGDQTDPCQGSREIPSAAHVKRIQRYPASQPGLKYAFKVCVKVGRRRRREVGFGLIDVVCVILDQQIEFFLVVHLLQCTYGLCE